MTQIEFPGLSGNQLYKLIKRQRIKWEKLIKCDIVLSRFDLVYERMNRSTDTIDTKEFINFFWRQFQESHPNRNFSVEKNKKGLTKE